MSYEYISLKNRKYLKAKNQSCDLQINQNKDCTQLQQIFLKLFSGLTKLTPDLVEPFCCTIVQTPGPCRIGRGS
jgi:hypothetical protein